MRHFRALLVLHIAVGVMYGLDYNQATFASSGGSESFCVCFVYNFLHHMQHHTNVHNHLEIIKLI